MMPCLPPKALRLLSNESQAFYFDSSEHLPNDECKEHLLACLFAIKHAHSSGRLTEQEKTSLKSSLSSSRSSSFTNSPPLPLDHLLEEERETLVSFAESYQSPSTTGTTTCMCMKKCGFVLNDYERDTSVAESYRSSLTISTTFAGMKKGGLVMCCVCLDSKDPPTDPGIWCSSQVEPHFTCSLCLQSYVQARSSHDTTAEIASLKARNGQLLCPMASDPSAPNVHLTCDTQPYSTQELATMLPSECNKHIPSIHTINTSYLSITM